MKKLWLLIPIFTLIIADNLFVVISDNNNKWLTFDLFHFITIGVLLCYSRFVNIDETYKKIIIAIVVFTVVLYGYQKADASFEELYNIYIRFAEMIIIGIFAIRYNNSAYYTMTIYSLVELMDEIKHDNPYDTMQNFMFIMTYLIIYQLCKKRERREIYLRG